MQSDLLGALACPTCHTSDLRASTETLRCERCGAAYPLVDGIPVLLPPGSGQAEKQRQAAYFDDAVDEDFEIARPNGAPRLYRWLLAEKFRRSVAGLESLVRGATVLTVCGGSGMDAEFLARSGARVIASDISLGAAQRAQERARRYGLAIAPVVADVERLPFRDHAVDLVYVHDGLHHLERPAAGLAEMTRVAGRAVSVNEPARAAVTALAIRLGLALEREEAGNHVARLTLEELTGQLAARGFRVVRAQRYAMYYRHEPGRPSRWLSRGPVLPLSKGAFRAVNGVAGAVGNKLTVQAVRTNGGGAR